ncbi:MAG: AGCS family alanine or glycine:cation symporter [Planctomycetota bacterium]
MDTIIVCTMTALVIVITGAYVKTNPDGSPTEFFNFIDSKNGAALTSQAFGTSISWFPYVLSVAVALFAFSTMISWSYYGERCFAWLFGDGLGLVYKALFLTFTFLGSVITAKAVLNFGDLMILGMAIPNVLGVVLLSGKVKKKLDEYVALKKSGEMKQTPGA